MGGFVFSNYAWEFSGLRFVRSFSDGLIFFEPRINLDRYRGDHSPKFEIYLILFNFMIFEFSIYNLNHIED